MTRVTRYLPIRARADRVDEVLPERYRVGQRFFDGQARAWVRVAEVVAEPDHVRVEMVEVG